MTVTFLHCQRHTPSDKLRTSSLISNEVTILSADCLVLEALAAVAARPADPVPARKFPRQQALAVLVAVVLQAESRSASTHR